MHCSNDKRPDKPWTEDYIIEDAVDAQKHAQNMVDEFNNTLRPKESPRTLLKVETETLGPILTVKEFLDEVNRFKIYIYIEYGHGVDKDKVEEIYEDMIKTGEVDEFKALVVSCGTTERYQRLVDSPIENLRYDVSIEDLKEEAIAENKIDDDPFENTHPLGIVKGGITIGVYADPMSMSSTQKEDFEHIESYIADGMEGKKYYTTRLEDPSEAIDGHFDLVVVDYGGMTIPGMSGMEESMTRAVQKILEEQPSTMVWLCSMFTVSGYMGAVEEEWGEEHSNLIIAEIEEEESWVPLHTLWGIND